MTSVLSFLFKIIFGDLENYSDPNLSYFEAIDFNGLCTEEFIFFSSDTIVTI